jgi:hypothetical protein
MNCESGKFASRKLFRFFAVVAGIILGQAILYGPCLTGQKILLPLDLLAQSGVYIPRTPETGKIVPHDSLMSDLFLQFEPARRFAASEIHQGRFPLWAPYHYGGVSFVWPKYSVFLLLECCTKSPVILAWAQLFAALVAGGGMYFFCRQTLRVSFWPAAVCAWCYPLTAFFVLWQGFPTGLSVYWLPWIFLCVDKTARGASPLAAVGLSVVTFLVLTSGHIDVAGQALLGSGIFALWCLWDAHPGGRFGRKSRRAVAMLVLGWGLGFFLAAPHILPLLEYAKTGVRMIHRSAGVEERPPVGLAALPEIVLPDIYGTTAIGSTRMGPPHEPNLLESSAAGYAGVLAALLVAPLAFCSPRHRAINCFWIFLAVFGLSWGVDIPGFVNLLRLPGLNMMSHNRLVFLTAFAILCLAAVGLENLLQGSMQRRWWFWPPAALLAGLCGWCIYRSMVLPAQIATPDSFDSFWRQKWKLIQITRDVHPVQGWFIEHYTVSALICGLGFVGWLLLWFQKTGRFRLFPMLVVFLMADLLWFDRDRSAQCDPSLYYPKVPVLEEIAKSTPGRIIGDMPASISMMAGLDDIRGYDSVDPARMVALLKTSAEPVPENPDPASQYAATLFLVPKVGILPPDTIHLAPVLDMLDVRYVIFRSAPVPAIHPPFQGNDYWVLVNSNALPRVFIPKSVETITNAGAELAALASPKFNPRDVAYVETQINLPASCRGTARIVKEIPTHITVSVNMQTPGLVVLADNWDNGWRAYYNGKPAPVLRANYAIRGVVVPEGGGTLAFIYRPDSLILGLWLAGFAAIVLLGWMIVIWIQSRKATPVPIKPNLQIDPDNSGC